MKRIIILFLIVNLIILTGCWDMIELNERAFPYSVGIDLNQEGDEKLDVTFSYPNINAIGEQAIEDEVVHVVTSKGNSFFDAAQNLTMELYQPFYFKHLKVLILSREVVENKELLLEVIDGIQRDVVTNNNASIIVTDSAYDLIQSSKEANIQQAIIGTLYSILVNNQGSNYFTPITASKFIQNMDETGAAVVPVGGFEENIVVGGGAVFKNFEYMGDITPFENRIVNSLNNEFDYDQIDVERRGIKLSLMITDAKTKRKLVDKENLKMKFDMEFEGHIHSHILDEEHDVDGEKILRELESVAEEQMNTRVNETIDRIQKELNSDIIFISDYLRKFHPSLWEEIKDDYDSVFPNIEIEAKVTFNIRRRGLTK